MDQNHANCSSREASRKKSSDAHRKATHRTLWLDDERRRQFRYS
jgi:hypothetical protein